MKTSIYRWIKNNFNHRVRLYAEQNNRSAAYALFRTAIRGAGRLELPLVEYAVTTCCTLHCKHCSNLIPRLQPGSMIGLPEFKNELDALLSCVDYIYRFKLHGGEPFLHPDLYRMIDYARSCEKIGEIRISTNGTIVPDKRLLQALAGPKVVVFLSDYPESVAPARAQVLQTLSSAKVRIRDLKGQTWSDLGGLEPRHYTSGQMKKLIRDCSMANCKALYNKHIYLCSRCANGERAGLFRVPEKVRIDPKDPRGTRKALRSLFCLTACEGCDRCDGVLADAPPIPAGIQIAPDEKNY